MTDEFRSEYDLFAQVPLAVLYAPVSDRAVRLFAVLLDYANAQHSAWPSRSTLGKDLGGVSLDSVDRAVRELRSLGVLEVVRRGGKPGDKWRSSVYVLKRPSRTLAARASRTRAARTIPTTN